MTIQQTLQANAFKKQLRDSCGARRRILAPLRPPDTLQYLCLRRSDGVVYFIESGQIKLLMLSSEGRVSSRHQVRRYFRRALLSDSARPGNRHGDASNVSKQIPCTQFFARLSRTTRCLRFVRYLAVRIADQQQVIANLVTVDSEQRLGQTLLQLARTMGRKIRAAFD
jgi:CRP-like cAMP-binding protein